MTSVGFVAVVDDDEAVLDSLERLLLSVSIAVRAYRSPLDFLGETALPSCECAILDLRMPGISGLELQRRLTALGYRMPLIFVSGYADIEDAVDAMKHGAVDFLRKPVGGQRLIETVQAAIAVHHRRRAQQGRSDSLRQRLETLTGREREIFHAIADSRTARQIATALGISAKTVDYHRTNIFTKLGTRKAAELATLAAELDQLDRFDIPRAHPRRNRG